VQLYVARRLVLFVPTLLGASLLIFVLMRLVPGDIAQILVYQTGSETSTVQEKQIAQIRTELGLDRPLLVQYAAWLGNALRLDFGESYSQRRPVRDILVERFPRSMELAILTMIFAMVWAIPLGVVSAVRQNTWLDYLARVLSISGLSLPIFFTGVLILYLLVRFFRYLPPLEYVALTEDPLENLKQLVWPALAHRFPQFEKTRCKATLPGLYDQNDFDGNPIIGPWEGHCANFYLAAGFSGHGLMHAPACGRALSELILDRRFTTLDLTRLGWRRVARGEPYPEQGII